MLSVLAAAALVGAGLSACQAKVGKAAFVDNVTISENDVASYVEATAQPPSASGSFASRGAG